MSSANWWPFGVVPIVLTYQKTIFYIYYYYIHNDVIYTRKTVSISYSRTSASPEIHHYDESLTGMLISTWYQIFYPDTYDDEVANDMAYKMYVYMYQQR